MCLIPEGLGSYLSQTPKVTNPCILLSPSRMWLWKAVRPDLSLIRRVAFAFFGPVSKTPWRHLGFVFALEWLLNTAALLWMTDDCSSRLPEKRRSRKASPEAA